MFNTTDAERLSGHPYRNIDRMRSINTIPFPEERRAYARQDFTPAEVFLLLAQRQVMKSWGLNSAEAAWAIRLAVAGIYENWELATENGYLIRERRSGAFHTWLADKAGLADHLKNAAETPDDYQWSAEAKDMLRQLQAINASETAIIRSLLKIDEAQIREWNRTKPQSLWFLELKPIFKKMFESAAALHMELPPLHDKAAWLSTAAK